MIKRNIRAFILLGFLILSFEFPCYGGVGSSAGVEFLRLGGGARPLGMGEAYVGLANDVSAMFYNPAGLAQIAFPEILTMSNNWFLDVKQQIAGFILPTNLVVIGIGYSGLSSGDIQGYDQNGAATSNFNTSSSSLNLSFGRKINPNLSLGIGIKTITEKLESRSGTAAAMDAGLLYRVNRNLRLGAAAMNLGSGITFITENTPLPTSYRLGAAFSTILFEEDINMAADYVSYPEGAKLNLGVEYLVRNTLAIRVGSSSGVLRAGLGITANLLSIDYAYLSRDDLGPTHQLSLSILFGAAERSKKLILENLAMGKAYLKEEKSSDAILKFEKVLELDPKNEEADLLLRRAQNELENQALKIVFAEKETEIKRGVDEILASGRDYLRQGKYIEALAEFGKVLKISPTHSEALRLQSEAQFRMESQLIQKSKEEAKEYLGEAMKLVVLGRYGEALKQVDLAVSKDQKNKEALALQKKLQFIINLEQR